jgi:hypothetical protein
MINKALDLGIPEPVETYSSSDNLFSDLHIDPSATGRLPKSARTRAGLDAEELEDLGEVGAAAGHRGKGGHGSRGDSRGGSRGGSGRTRSGSGGRGGRSDGER